MPVLQSKLHYQFIFDCLQKRDLRWLKERPSLEQGKQNASESLKTSEVDMLTISVNMV